MDLTGQKFGKLTVRGPGPDKITASGRIERTWICDCECGNEKIILQASLRSGSAKSCGCRTFKRKENKYDLSGEYGVGYTIKGEKFYFDLEDYDRLKEIYWYKGKNGYFVGVDTRTRAKNRKKKITLMHRYIMNAPEDMIVDHIGGINTIHDNRKINLRVVTKRQNQINHKLYGHNTSGITGVYWIQKIRKWEAVIVVEGKKVRLGQYKNKEDAIKARKVGEEKYYKDYSYDRSQEIYKEVM